MKVLSFGSLNIDNVYKVKHFVQKGETLASSSLTINSGGKGLNQSIALAKAGLEVYHAGAIGQDGKFLLHILHADEVNTDFVKCLDNVKTGHAIIQNDDAGDNCILLFKGANHCITRTQIDETLAHFSTGDALVLQNEINELEYLSQQAKARGTLIALNPSPLDDYLLLNEIEAGQLLGEQSDDFEATARVLLSRYPDANILMTLGSQGSIFVNKDNFIKQGIIPVKPVDTTAAGDTYTGYFLANVFEDKDFAKAMKLATIASSIAITRPGAAQSIPTKEEVLERA